MGYAPVIKTILSRTPVRLSSEIVMSVMVGFTGSVAKSSGV